ncbi:TPA: hypothetical protein ENS27_03110 [bacterium]|nr:hypothetical protein [bacterium]
MTTTKELLTVALNGGTPEITPYSLYSWMMDDPNADKWKRLFDMGLGTSEHCGVVGHIEHGVENIHEEKIEGNNRYTIYKKKTPIGTIEQIHLNGWHYQSFIKTPQDYKIMQWITENTELKTYYESYERSEQIAGNKGVVIVSASRTPAMTINVDWAGTQQFCLDVAMEVPELFDLYEARKKLILEEYRLIAEGPGRFVKIWENLTISMLGPKRYEELLLSFYNECMPAFEKGGKKVMVHYDGGLSVIKDQIKKAPFHIIESLTEPPEGDMTYDQCREAWQEKIFLGNINIAHYYKPEKELREAIIGMRERAGKKAFAFEISEDLPRNWQTSIPIILDTLKELK